MSKNNWWVPLAVVLVTGLAGVLFMGIRTYQDAPPIPDFKDISGQTIISHESILDGQVVFQRKALMDYGSMFGDGAGRGPDFTAEALHRIALAMQDYYRAASPDPGNADLATLIPARVKKELRTNNYDPATNAVILTTGQVEAYRSLSNYYRTFFAGHEVISIHPNGYISSEQDIRCLSSFFFWGAWVCSAERPGYTYSYTHNWPFDEVAGNVPGPQIILWSMLGCLGLMLGLGAVLYLRGRLDRAISVGNGDKLNPVITEDSLVKFVPTSTQRATYKFFVAAAVVFMLQVLAGVLTIHDFVKLTSFLGVDISNWLPHTVTRGWHLQLSLFWISTCWIGGSIFVLPSISKHEPAGQLGLINGLFTLLMFLVLGSTVGIYLGPAGVLGPWWHALGNQGWEFVEFGKVWQSLLFISLGLWAVILYRGSKTSLEGPNPLALPNWLFYSVLSVLVLFCSGFVAGPRTNFVITDFWRWCVIHMWVEAFFEVFTTALIAYFMYIMGLVTFNSASRIVYLATLLFLGSGLLGISHNFYWNAKPVEMLAIGSIFSTLQVVPLLLLTLEAWKLRNMPATQMRASGQTSRFAQPEAFLFLLGVNFWNFLGAGVFGFIINLPIVNYYEHGTYLTVNHGHAALMGVYGNLALAAIIYCARYLVREEFWNGRLLKVAFWSMNIGLVLMVVLDLFPAGILQFNAVLNHGFWFARSQEFINGIPFQTLTWMRAVGGYIFLLGGVTPITWFVVSRVTSLRDSQRPALSHEPDSVVLGAASDAA